MRQRRQRRTAERPARKSHALPARRFRLAANVGRPISDVYHQLDDQLTRMAHIQLQFDRLLSKIKLL
jgi:hypothetical protein